MSGKDESAAGLEGNPMLDWADEGEEEACWNCHGEGRWHDCMDDSCACLRPRRNVTCRECNGRGYL